MALLKEHISHITSILSNGIPTDDYQFSDQQIYFILKSVRSFLLTQKLTRGKYISPFNYQTIPCFKLKNAKIQDCECFTSDCYALQGNCSLPTILTSDKGLIVDGVYTINVTKPQRLDKITLDSYRLSKYSKTMQDPKGWMLHDADSTFYVTGFSRLAAVKIRALFDDPLEVMSLPISCACNEDGSAICVDPYTVEFPLDSDLSKALWSMTYDEMLRVALKMMPDLKNDARPAYGAVEKK